MATTLLSPTGPVQVLADMTPRISLYLPCYNVAEFLPQIFDGIFSQTLQADEVLVIDDGSRDATVEVASRYPVRVIRHEKNSGLAATRNTAFRHARNDLIAALDADCVPQSGWLETLASHVANPNVAAAGGRLVETALTTVADRWRKAHMTQDWGESPVRNPRVMFGNNLLIRKAAVEQVGGYDERLRTNGEDVSLSQRFYAGGFHGIYDPAAVVHHLRCDNSRSVLDMFWRYRRDYLWTPSFKGAIQNWRYYYFGLARQTLLKDFHNRSFEFFGLDLRLFWHMLYCDLRLARQSQRASAGARKLAEA